MLEISIYYNYVSYNEYYSIKDDMWKSILTIVKKQYIFFHEYIQSFSNLISYYSEGKIQFVNKTNLRNLKYYVNKY
jgi:hypothetical protein